MNFMERSDSFQAVEAFIKAQGHRAMRLLENSRNVSDPVRATQAQHLEKAKAALHHLGELSKLYVEELAEERKETVDRFLPCGVLREHPLLKDRLAVFSNDDAPPGWCEIQRLDQPDNGADPYATDLEAGLDLVEHAGMPGTCMEYSPSARMMLRTDSGQPHHPWIVQGLGSLIVIVPVDAAFRMRLIDREQAIHAMQDYT